MADSLNLSDSQEFEAAVRAAAEYHGILPELVRKDYWVTRVLRAIAGDGAHQGMVLFKGGTSLSKGWRLIERFSEDVDLLLTGPNFGPVPERVNDRVRSNQYRVGLGGVRFPGWRAAARAPIAQFADWGIRGHTACGSGGACPVRGRSRAV